ncbi:ribosome maturation factor RimP [Tomitella fengzijianii]|uniref:Ribosome maturation factor RimP n=1 Tax=Tomitella fengzijianii TaxID=2597660 RepID=A0A516X4T5_9ACTN|nr:ribosome maturation factor RimP [Tomitella fengzijianii]QDQ97671.1 ribosome maturation factor RimP [Tomitella fengzijianii]
MPVPTREQVMELLTAPVRRDGAEVEDVEVTSAGAKSVVRVVLDSERGLSLDDVVEFTDVVSGILDGADAGYSPYTLEVTSRGVDRPLTLPRHWRRARGRRAEVRTGEETLVGRVGALDTRSHPAVVDLVIPGRAGPAVRQIPLDRVDSAVVQVEFSKPDPREIALSGGPAPEGPQRAVPGIAAKEKDK